MLLAAYLLFNARHLPFDAEVVLGAFCALINHIPRDVLYKRSVAWCLQVSCEEKAVNTRSQDATTTQSGDEAAGDATTTTDTDNSLMARRRRRRERAQTAYIMHAHGQSVDGVLPSGTTHQITATSPGGVNITHHSAVLPGAEVEGHQMTLQAERRLLRAAFSLNSVDTDDVFYDAVNNSSHKQL